MTFLDKKDLLSSNLYLEIQKSRIMFSQAAKIKNENNFNLRDRSGITGNSVSGPNAFALHVT